MVQPEGQDHPTELAQLIAAYPVMSASAFVKMLSVHWTPHEIFDMLQAHLKEITGEPVLSTKPATDLPPGAAEPNRR